MTYNTTPAPEIPTGPILSQLAGMDEARKWGEGLAQDIGLYRAGSLDWTEIEAGCFVYGPPGTGKTTFARALAATAKLPMIATSYADWNRGTRYAADIINAVKAVFATADANRPCLVAIDELDSLPARDNLAPDQTGVHMIINSVLEEIDGLNRRSGIVVIGTCNHLDRLDPALVRPGRLGRSIKVPLPDVSALPKILAYHLKSDAPAIGDVSNVAILCAGMSGAAIEQVVREARQHARRNGRKLHHDDLVRVIDSRLAVMSNDELRRVALHEAGHGVAALRLLGSRDITLSVVPNGVSWGRVIAGDTTRILTRAKIEAQLMVLLSGRAAEHVVLAEPSGGAGGDASSDLVQASELALQAVSLWGLSQSGSPFWHGKFQKLGVHSVPASVFAEARQMVDDAYGKALSFIKAEGSFVHAATEALVKSRALTHAAFAALDPQARISPPRRDHSWLSAPPDSGRPQGYAPGWPDSNPGSQVADHGYGHGPHQQRQPEKFLPQAQPPVRPRPPNP